MHPVSREMLCAIPQAADLEKRESLTRQCVALENSLPTSSRENLRERAVDRRRLVDREASLRSSRATPKTRFLGACLHMVDSLSSDIPSSLHSGCLHVWGAGSFQTRMLCIRNRHTASRGAAGPMSRHPCCTRGPRSIQSNDSRRQQRFRLRFCSYCQPFSNFCRRFQLMTLA